MPKVFELAKDLDMRSLDLVEKLKELGIAVRNHMSALSDEDAQKALSALKTKSCPPKKTTKKVVKKKVTLKKVVKKTPRPKTDASPPPDSVGRSETLQPALTPPKPIVEGPRVVRKKASRIAEEKAQKAQQAKEREEKEAKRVELAAKSQSKGLQVVFDPSKKTESIAEETRTRETISPQLLETKGLPPHVAESAKNAEREGGDSKKRMGVLSQMMAKGRQGKRDLIKLRADEEIKSYGLGNVGKINYAPVKRKKVYLGLTAKTTVTEVKEEKRYVNVEGIITGAELAKKIKVKFKDFAGRMLERNLLIKSQDYLGVRLAQELADVYGYRVRDISFKEDVLIKPRTSLADAPQQDSDFPLRHPVVAVMGHVDHGKTTLLDSIRKAKVAEGEAGGITQHIGAYQVAVGEQKLTFLDTPGHAAFSAMRQRGADITDIVILVVAADDGVMPQTRESVRYCQQAQTPIVVAVNKIDKEGAKRDRVQQELSELGLIPEDWGGDTQYVDISALKGQGLDELLERVKLVAEMLELKVASLGPAQGVVIESRVETGRGPMTTILVQSGNLEKGDYLVAGEVWGRAKSLMDYGGGNLKSAAPGDPVQVLGFQEAPVPGSIISTVKNEREAKKIISNRADQRKQLANVKVQPKLSLEDFFGSEAEQEGESRELKLIVRTDVQGSFEAIKNGLETLGNDEVAVKVIGGGVGAITDNDVALASNINGYIIGFNMRPVTSARHLADQQGVDIKTYLVIYELIDDVRSALEGMLDPEKVEVYIGRATVKETFTIPKVGVIAGSAVIDGKIKKGCHVRLLRDGKIVFDGKMSSLRHFKDDVKEAANGTECGISLEGFSDIKREDIFEAYMLEERKRTLKALEGAAL